MGIRVASACARAVVVVFACAGLIAPATASAVPRPADDPFYAYTSSTPLADLAPGTVIRSRDVSYHVAGLALPLSAKQLAYRSTNMLGEPIVASTTLIRPPGKKTVSRVVSYQSAYDSLSPSDQPSHVIAGGPATLGSAISTLESLALPAFLLNGYGVAIPDTEGPMADFAAGPEYGYTTLDGLRAAFKAKYTRMTDATKVVLFGYSGGAIGTEWAAELAPTYAPDVNEHLIGAAMGGVLVKPSTNLHYVDGSPLWAGVMPMAIVGVARSFRIDLLPYLSDYGKSVYRRLQRVGIVEALATNSGVTWAKLAKPEYREPESVAIYVEAANKLIMGSYGTPTIPLFIGQGAKGELEGTKGNRPGIGKGDGVMVAGDVRSLARKYCDQGVPVKYRQYGQGSHATTVLSWGPQAIHWIDARFKGAVAPQNCAEIAPGNSLEPIAVK